MIHAVCLNAALDLTYHVPRLSPGRTHRVDRVTRRAGGKAVNVARVLHQLGDEVRVIGFAGGDTGHAVKAELDSCAVPHLLVPIGGETRRTVTVVAGDEATVFNEPGPAVSTAEWQQLVARLSGSIAAGDVLVLAGSVPPSLPVTAYAELIALAAAHSALSVLDTDGPGLQAALAAAPALAKLNLTEATAALSVTDGDPLTAAGALLAAGAANAVVSCGPDGLVAVVDGRALRVRLSERVAGNPTGAGDALTAGIARGLANRLSWSAILRDATALGAAAVAVHHAGAFDEAVRERVRAGVEVEEF